VPLAHALIAELGRAGGGVALDVPLARRTWWGVGGPADAVVAVESASAAVAVLGIAARWGVPVVALGNGSNVLVADAGVRGIVLRLVGDLAAIGIERDERTVLAGGGAQLPVLTGRAGKGGWTGLEAFAGIPGTVGGAVRMNAGTSLGDAAGCLVDVDLALPGGLERRSVEALGLSYRHSELPAGAVVVSARLRATGGDADRSRALVAEHLARRAATQPVDVRSCGSTFRNPPGDHAGRLIESVGLKGHASGRVRVSPIHANFVENLGGATAAELWAFVTLIRTRVAEERGVWLVPEVERVGDWGDQPQGPAAA
jgi:UDP-N-acetylmuramate dehydrogenase